MWSEVLTPHPLLQVHDPVKKSLVLVLTSNRGLAGGYNGNVVRRAMRWLQDAQVEGIATSMEVAVSAPSASRTKIR